MVVWKSAWVGVSKTPWFKMCVQLIYGKDSSK